METNGENKETKHQHQWVIRPGTERKKFTKQIFTRPFCTTQSL